MLLKNCNIFFLIHNNQLFKNTHVISEGSEPLIMYSFSLGAICIAYNSFEISQSAVKTQSM